MRHVIKDLVLVAIGIVLAFVIAGTDIVSMVLLLSENIRIISSFVGGLFFTSLFTSVPAIVFLGKISLIENPYIVAGVGGLGAVLGDLLIFNLFRDHVAADFDQISKNIKFNPSFLRKGYFRWFGMVMGALIIASPFPDELGVAMMGLSKIKLKIFIPISFVLNALGILAIALTARLLVN